MVKTLRYFCGLLILLTVFSCATASKIVSKDIRLGMSRDQVIGLLGLPFKKSAGFTETGVQYENLFYKERVNIKMGGAARMIENILYFENDILKAIDQGDEQVIRSHTYDTPNYR